MILLNKPTTLSINTSQTITLNVSELSSSISSAVGAYESDSANWKIVEFIYKNDTQIKRLIFRLNKSIEEYSLIFNEYSLLGNFECVKIRIEDYQADSVVIKRDQFASLFGSTTIFDIEATDEPVDVTPPAILSYQAPNAGTYRVGDNFDYDFTFSEPVLVQGTPSVTIYNTTDLANYLTVSYVSGSGTNVLKFRYTIESTLTPKTDIVVRPLSPIQLNGGSIRDAAGNNSQLTFDSILLGNFTFNDNLTSTITKVESTHGSTNLVSPFVFRVIVWYQSPVTFTNVSNLQLNATIGSTNKIMNYESHANITSEITEITFAYTVQSGDLDTDGVTITSLNLNGATVVNSVSGNPADNSFSPVTTPTTIGTSSGFNVNEVPGFTEVIESLEVLENPTSTSVLYVFGIHESSPYRRLYRIDSSLNVTNPFNIKNTSNESMAFLQYRSTTVVNTSGWNDVIFRARNVSDQRKLFRWNPLAATLTQISNTNPSGEDLPEAVTNFIYSDIGETSVDQVVYFSSVNSSGFTKLHMYNVSTGSVTQISNTNPTGDDNPHDMVRFTESTGEEFLYFISTQAISGGNEERRLYKVNINGIVTQINLPIDTPYAKGFYNSNTDSPYPPYNTFTNGFRSKSIVKYENSLFIYTSSSAVEVGGSYLKLNNSGTFTTVYEGQLQLESIITDGYFRGYNFTTGQWKLYKIPNSGLAVEVTGITDPVPWSIAGSNLYAAGVLDLFNSFELLKIDMTTQIITRTTTTIPVRPGNFENGGISFSKYNGYIYFSGSIATRSPSYTSLYRTLQGSTSVEDVFSYHRDVLFLEDIGDGTKNIVNAAGKLFFTIVNQDDSTTRLCYITQT